MIKYLEAGHAWNWRVDKEDTSEWSTYAGNQREAVKYFK